MKLLNEKAKMFLMLTLGARRCTVDCVSGSVCTRIQYRVHRFLAVVSILYSSPSCGVDKRMR